MTILIADKTLEYARRANNGRGLRWVERWIAGGLLSKEETYDLMNEAIYEGFLRVVRAPHSYRMSIFDFGPLFRDGARSAFPFSGREAVRLSLYLERDVRDHLIRYSTLRMQGCTFTLVREETTDYIRIQVPTKIDEEQI